MKADLVWVWISLALFMAVCHITIMAAGALLAQAGLVHLFDALDWAMAKLQRGRDFRRVLVAELLGYAAQSAALLVAAETKSMWRSKPLTGAIASSLISNSVRPGSKADKSIGSVAKSK
jgi:hypothetical protein